MIAVDSTASASIASGGYASNSKMVMRTMSKSSTTIKGRVPVPPNGLRPVHPGEVLREDFLNELGMSGNELAAALGVPANRINAICGGKRGISADTALRLGRYFGTSPQFWLNLQQSYDLKIAERTHGKAIVRTVRRRAA